MRHAGTVLKLKLGERVATSHDEVTLRFVGVSVAIP